MFLEFVLLFILKIKCKLTRRNQLPHICNKYGYETLRLYRKYEATYRRFEKAQCDVQFLEICRSNEVFPNFIKFKLYRRSLYSTPLYKDALWSLLNNEINFKLDKVNSLRSLLFTLNCDLKSELSFCDYVSLTSVIRTNLQSYIDRVKSTHEKKLGKLNLTSPKFLNPDAIIFNFSDYVLSQREKFLLSLGLNFNLPFFKKSFTDFYLPLEKLASDCKHLPGSSAFNSFINKLSFLARDTFNKLSKLRFSSIFFFKSDFKLLKALGSNNDIIVSRPDKGNGVVILNRVDYLSKMNDIISDGSKFHKIIDDLKKVTYRIEDKINRFLKSMSDRGVLSHDTYNQLRVTGSNLGVLYGLPKIHKSNIPLRPILSAYSMANYKLAKFLVPWLSPISSNQYTLTNSYSFCHDILRALSDGFMVSFDVSNLFTNVPLQETIEIILNHFFRSRDSLFNNFNRKLFKKLLDLSMYNSFFTFDGSIYQQVDGLAMGSPLGPIFANIFMCSLEASVFAQCNPSLRPLFYRRYVDDTFAIFPSEKQAVSFFEFINNFHPKINFTIEKE